MLGGDFMALYDVLNEFEKNEGELYPCFNGYLEDYLALNPEEGSVLDKIQQLDPQCRVLTNYPVTVNKNLVSNKIIRYKDIYKIPQESLKVSYILYSKTFYHDAAIVIYDGSYYEAKGCYYAMTEQGALLGPYRSRVLFLSSKDVDTLSALYEIMILNRTPIQSLQREQNRKHYGSSHEFCENATLEASHLLEWAKNSIIEEAENRENVIHEVVGRWFYLKKAVYVEYMGDSDILKNENENDIDIHRKKAKESSNKVQFMPFSELWRLE